MKVLAVVVIGLAIIVQAHRKSTVPPCSSSDDCPAHLACERLKCLDPCEGACGVGAQCEVRNHQPYCSCNASRQQDSTHPSCTKPQQCSENEACINGACVDPCTVADCGPNSQCKASQHTASCISTATEPPVPTEPNPVTPTPCTLECAGDDQCPPAEACVDHLCTDPCSGRCGANATCRVVNHVPSCSCNPDHTGDPFKRCSHHPGSDCPQNWPPTSAGVKKFKAESVKKLDWLEATLECMSNGQRLATVKTQQELADIKKAIRNTYVRGGNFWIGGTDHLHNKEWFWFLDNQRIGAVTDWMSGQPDSDGEDCLEFWEANQQVGYKWNDRTCNERHYYVCEYF